MKRFFAAAFLAALPVLAPLSAQAPSGNHGQGVIWHEDLDSALVAAKSSHKQVLLDIWAEWCPPCQRMRTEVFPSPQGQSALKRVVAASVMTEKKDRSPIATGQAIAQKYQLEAYPTLLILDENGTVLRRHVGYMNAVAFAKFVAGE